MSSKKVCIAVLIALVSGGSSVATPSAAAASRKSAIQSHPEADTRARREQDARRRVREFLEVWFSRRDLKGAFGYFASSAFTNQDILSQPCVGIFEDGPKSPEQIRKGVRHFLRSAFEVFNGPKGRPLSEILGWVYQGDGEGLAVDLEEHPTLRDAIVNDWRTDHFLILYADDLGDLLEEPSTWFSESLLRELADREILLSFAPFKSGGAVYFIWVLDEGVWKIHHADMICM